MARLIPSLPFVLLLVANAPALHAQTPPPTPFHGSLSALKGKAFTEGPFSISVNNSWTVFGDLRLEFRVANTGDSGAPFEWGDLAIVGADGDQPPAETTPQNPLALGRTTILPGAHTMRFFIFGPTKYPVKLYYQGQLLAEFTK